MPSAVLVRKFRTYSEDLNVLKSRSNVRNRAACANRIICGGTGVTCVLQLADLIVAEVVKIFGLHSSNKSHVPSGLECHLRGPEDEGKIVTSYAARGR